MGVPRLHSCHAQEGGPRSPQGHVVALDKKNYNPVTQTVPYSEGNMRLVRRLQRPWFEANNSFLSSTEVKIAWIHKSTPLYTVRTRCLMKCRNTRKLTLIYLLFWLLVDWNNSSHCPNILCPFKLKRGPIAFAVLVCKRTLKMKKRNLLCIFIGQSLSSLKLLQA
jgi:hypothetical protein